MLTTDGEPSDNDTFEGVTKEVWGEKRKKSKTHHSSDVTTLREAIVLLEKAAEYKTEGLRKLHSVVNKNNSLKLLGDAIDNVFASNSDTSSTKLKEANMTKLHPQKDKKSVGDKPKYSCPLCTKRGGWSAVNAHIREVHTGKKYGPCSVCKTFVTANQDSFRKHCKKCKK